MCVCPRLTPDISRSHRQIPDIDLEENPAPIPDDLKVGDDCCQCGSIFEHGMLTLGIPWAGLSRERNAPALGNFRNDRRQRFAKVG